MYCHDPEDRVAKELITGVNAKTFWGEQMLAAVVDFDAHAQIPRHSHPHEQLGIVIEGKIEFIVADDKKILGPGEVYVIPGDVEHEARTFDHPVKVLDVFSPVREEYKY